MKLLWLMENVDVIKDAIKKRDAIFGTIDTWTIWNMTGGVNGGLDVTDVTNASSTMIMNLKTLKWEENTLKTLGIPAEILPKIVRNSEVNGEICKGWPIPGSRLPDVLATKMLKCWDKLARKVRLRVLTELALSFSSTLLNTGDVSIKSDHGLLTTLSYKLGPQAKTNYAIEGSIAIAGAAVQWLRDSLGIIKSASENENLAAMVESTGRVYFVPAFNGLFAPWWREDARGVCIGIARFTNKSHIERAVLESMCFQVTDVLDSMNKDAGEKGSLDNEKMEFLLRVDGGATANNLLMQIQADLMGTPVVRPVDRDNSTRSILCSWTGRWILEGRRHSRVRREVKELQRIQTGYGRRKWSHGAKLGREHSISLISFFKN